MERLAQLIGKLNEQFEQNADPGQLLLTTQLIEAELVRLSSATRPALSNSRVAVVMPSNSRSYNTITEAPIATIEEKAPEEPAEDPLISPVTTVKTVEKNGNGSYNGNNGANGSKKQDSKGYQFDPLREIPTLSHQQSVKELNETMASSQSSLNDKLKEEIVEVGHLLNDSPVRDLRRAIGINDKFVFITELFRGDEVMYERSIKTINGFRIFAEAEYWIERELKVKLGWDETRESTRHFYQIVRRRFS
jgi:hypothetical protein